MCNVQTGEETTGRNMSLVEKRLEGKCMGWKNDLRENVWGGKMTGGNTSVKLKSFRAGSTHIQWP